MRNLFLLFVVFACLLAYVYTKKPEVWNSWMVAIGANSLVNPATTTVPDADGAGAPAPGSAASTRVPPVGGLIRNGYFAAGEGYWEGDGVSDPSGKGLVVRLNPSSWTRVYQQFAGQGGQYSIEVTYRFSPGLSVSRDPTDYSEICKRLQITGFEKFDSLAMSPGEFFGTIGDPTTTRIAYEVYSPQLGSTDVQDYQHDYPAVTVSGSTIFALAFPPGTGTVTLLSAYVKSR